MSLLAPALQEFFTQRLVSQKNASPHTIASYRDCWRMLLAFVHGGTGTPPSKLTFDDLDAAVIGAFLDHLEHQRGASIASRNTRLAARALVLRLRGAAPPRERGAHRPRPGDPAETRRTGPGVLPHQH